MSCLNPKHYLSHGCSGCLAERVRELEDALVKIRDYEFDHRSGEDNQPYAWDVATRALGSRQENKILKSTNASSLESAQETKEDRYRRAATMLKQWASAPGSYDEDVLRLLEAIDRERGEKASNEGEG